MTLKVYNFDKYFQDKKINLKKYSLDDESKVEVVRLEPKEFHKALLFEFGNSFMIADDEACRVELKNTLPFELDCGRMKEKSENGHTIFLGTLATVNFSLEEIKNCVPVEDISFDDFFDRLHNKSRIYWNFTGMLEDLEKAGLTKEVEELRKAAEK